MIEYDVTLNGMALNKLISRYGYTTGLEPVEGSAVTTLDTRDHIAVVRYRNTAVWRFDPMDLDTLSDIMTAIKVRSPVQIKMYSLQLREPVLFNARVEAVQNSLAIISGSRRIVGGFELSVSEL